MSSTTIIAAIVAIMVELVPPGLPKFVPEAMETKEETLQRYQEIAEAIEKVAYDEKETPIISRRFTVAQLVSITYYESRWRRDVDLGLGREKLKGTKEQDGGKSFCMGQILVDRGTTLEGWTGEELVRDRDKCFRAILHAAKRSYNSCRDRPHLHQLSVYASGNCDDGHRESEARVGLADRLTRRIP